MDTIVFYHCADSDGLMSRYILDKIYKNDALFFGYDYNPESLMNIFGLDTNPVKDFIFVDCTPTSEFIDRVIYFNTFEKIKKSIYIFDHHISEHNRIKEKYGEHINIGNDSLIKYYFDDQNCAAKLIKLCLLTCFKIKLYFENYPNFPSRFYESKNKNMFTSNNVLNKVIDYIDFYDTWKIGLDIFDEKDIHDIVAFNYYLKVKNKYFEFKTLIDLITIPGIKSDKNFRETLERGYSIVEKLLKDNEKNISNGKPINVLGYSFHLSQGYPNYFINRTFKTINKFDGYICYEINLAESNVKLHVRTFGNVKAYEITKHLDSNGGGHENAAGCTIDLERFVHLINNRL